MSTGKPAEPKKSSPVATVAGLFLKVLWIAFIVATPILGAWVASSLAAYANGPVALAAASGLLAFPVLPLAWDAWANYRRSKKKVHKPRILTMLDRLVLRTLAVNLLFLGVLVGTRPQPAFAALSTRGDWFLDGSKSETAEAVRKRVFWAADRLEWLYLAVHSNPFDDPNAEPAPSATGSAAPVPTAKPSGSAPSPAPSASASNKPRPDKPSPDKPSPDKPHSTPKWPGVPDLHPAVASMPKDAEQSIATVARYIAERDSTEAGRFRAAHDWVADRIAYDGPSYVAGKYPPQDAQSVFERRVGVCAGYAKLLAAIGQAMGLEVHYVVGDARTSGDDETGDSHAWSAVKIGDEYYLADATWDSGTLDGETFNKSFRTDYVFTPPEVFGQDHFPRDPKWQLRGQAISRGDFFRQPMMTPRFHAEGRELLSPTRSQVTVSGPFTAEIKTKSGLFTLATWSLAGHAERTNCDTQNGDITRVTCNFPQKGKYLVRLFSSAVQYGKYDYIGQLEANRE